MSNSDGKVTSSVDFDESTFYFGKVKWFNNKAGYGFCTVVGEEGGDRVGEDVFVHHTGVNVSSEQYKYLVQGEYVHFTLRSSDSNSHPYQAVNLTGPWLGKLMCETRNEQRQQRADYDESHGDTERSQKGPPRRKSVRLHGAGPREGGSWSMANDKTSAQSRSKQEE